MEKAKKSKKNRKVGRSANYCKFYAQSRRREHNKIRCLKKHLKRFSADMVAKKAIDHCQVLIRSY